MLSPLTFLSHFSLLVLSPLSGSAFSVFLMASIPKGNYAGFHSAMDSLNTICLTVLFFKIELRQFMPDHPLLETEVAVAAMPLLHSLSCTYDGGWACNRGQRATGGPEVYV